MRFGLGLGLGYPQEGGLGPPPAVPSSLSFNGIDEMLSLVPQILFPSNTARTVTVWVKPKDEVDLRGIFSKDSGTDYGGREAGGGAGTGRSRFRINAVNLGIPSANTMPANVWHLMGYTSRSPASTWSHFTDGVQSATSSNSVQSWTIDRIGRRGNGAGYWFGNICEMTVWKRALTAPEQATVWNGGVFQDPTTGPLAAEVDHHWRMGLGDSAPTIHDLVGGVDLSMVNMDNFNFVADHP